MITDDAVLDRGAITAWMDERGLGSGELGAFRPLAGGTQNVMVMFTRAGQSYVLRRGPRHLRARSNQNILREMRLLGALASTDVPHPRLIASCDRQDLLHGAVFYLMEPVDGFNAAVGLPPAWEQDGRVHWSMGLAMADALASLGTVDYEQVGLTGFGKPDGFLERQVTRWMGELDSFSALAEYEGPQLGGIEPIATWLEDNRPRSWAPGILHGDYHVANVMFGYRVPEVAAIVDWEMSTIGDPLLDLGSLLAVWPQADGEDDLIGSALARLGGLPPGPELVARYAERSDRDLSALDWYVVLGCFKLGIILEGTYARAQAGQADIATGDRLHATSLRLFDRARRRIAG
jgi:aminoglycoside phosphotransferase (APT) family kinase protein